MRGDLGIMSALVNQTGRRLSHVIIPSPRVERRKGDGGGVMVVVGARTVAQSLRGSGGIGHCTEMKGSHP